MSTDDQLETSERTAFDIMNERIKRQHELLEKDIYELKLIKIESCNLDAGESYYSKKSKYRRKQKYGYYGR